MSDIINMGMSFLSFLRYPDSIRYSRHVLTTKPYIQKSKIFEHLYVVNCKNVHLMFQKNFLEISTYSIAFCGLWQTKVFSKYVKSGSMTIHIQKLGTSERDISLQLKKNPMFAIQKMFVFLILIKKNQCIHYFCQELWFDLYIFSLILQSQLQTMAWLLRV